MNRLMINGGPNCSPNRGPNCGPNRGPNCGPNCPNRGPQSRPSIVNRPIQVSHEECNWQLWPVGGDGPKSIKLTLVKAEPSIWKQLLKKEEGGATGDADGNVRKKKD